MPAIRDAFKRKPLSELTVKLTEARILERVNDFIEFIDHPQVRETGLISCSIIRVSGGCRCQIFPD